MAETLTGKRIALLVADGFEQIELTEPKRALEEAGARALIVSPAKGRRVTSYPSIQTDLKNAGAVWVDEEVVDDNGLITSRNPNDLPAFNAKLIETIAAG